MNHPSPAQGHIQVTISETPFSPFSLRLNDWRCLWDMGNAYVLTLEPTFTQGLIIGQLSILFLLFFILKYLFFDFASSAGSKFSYQPRLVINEVDGIRESSRDKPRRAAESEALNGDVPLESTDWLNVVLQQV